MPSALGHGTGIVTVFTPEGNPFQLPESAFTSLERRALAKLEPDRAGVEDLGVEMTEGARVINDAVGRFALWGFPDAADRKLLPAAEETKK